jgi:hypothetical protein
MAYRLRMALGTLSLFAALALTAGCDANRTGSMRSSSTMGPPTRGGAADPMPTTATGQNAVTNPSMSGSPGINRPYMLGSDPNLPASSGDNTGVQGKPSGTGP